MAIYKKNGNAGQRQRWRLTSALAGQGDAAREERQAGADDGQDQLDAPPLLLLHLPPLLFKGEGGELAPLKVGFLHGGGVGMAVAM